jgi:O-succinylbenzoic acid--CoA ligase
MFRLRLHSSEYTIADILSWDGEHENPPFKNILQLSKEWLTGATEFSTQTSGSTGTPQQISLSREQIIASASKSLLFFELKPGDAVICPLSIDVIGGKMMLYRSIIGDLQLQVIHPDRALKEMPSEAVFEFMPITALQLFEVLKHHPEKINTLNKLRHLLIGGGTVSSELMHLIQAKLSCKVWQSYGMTETVSHIALRALHPIEETSYTILNNIDIDTDERGCLKIKGDVTNQQWVQTNDIVDILDSNHFVFSGRADFVINSGGIKIQVEPLEELIEQILKHLDIHTHFFIRGIHNPEYGEKVVLMLEGITLTDKNKNHLLQELKKELPKHHAPKDVFTLPSFVYTPSGKINRKETVKSV